MPPTTVEGASDIPARIAGLMESVAVLVAFRAVAEIVAEANFVTPKVAIGKLTELCPAGMVTKDGTVAAVLEDFNWTTTPPDGAVPVRLTVAAELSPPARLLGSRVMDSRAGASTVTVTFLES